MVYALLCATVITLSAKVYILDWCLLLWSSYGDVTDGSRHFVGVLVPLGRAAVLLRVLSALLDTGLSQLDARDVSV
jgi:hypothetical protein